MVEVICQEKSIPAISQQNIPALIIPASIPAIKYYYLFRQKVVREEKLFRHKSYSGNTREGYKGSRYSGKILPVGVDRFYNRARLYVKEGSRWAVPKNEEGLMPNWCSNSLTIRGEKSAILALMERARSGEHVFVGPFQGGVEGYDWGSFTPIQMEVLMNNDDLFLDKSDNKSVLCFHAFVPMPREVMLAPYDGNRLKEAAAKYPEWFGRFPGLLSGYDWEHKNFGVKWGACEAHIVNQDGSDDDYSVTYEFDTAWGPAMTFMDAIAALYPDLHFSLSYDEPGVGFAGNAEWSNGQCILNDQWESEEEDSEEEEEDYDGEG